MSDLISRQDAIESIASDIKYLEGEINKCESNPSKYTDNFKLLITSASATCNLVEEALNMAIEALSAERTGNPYFIEEYHYCPSCKARMKGDTTEQSR